MSAKNNRPSSHTGAVKDPAGGLIDSNSTVYPARIHLTPSATEYLEQLAKDLMLGRCALDQLPSCLLQFWSFGYSTGRASRQEAIDNLSAENDRLYLRAYNSPEKIREIYQRRLDGHFEREAALYYGEVSA